MSKNKYNYFLEDVGLYIRERAEEARDKYRACAKDSDDRDSKWARMFAFNEVISLLQQTMDSMGIAHSEMSLDGIDPDKDLT